METVWTDIMALLTLVEIVKGEKKQSVGHWFSPTIDAKR